MIQYDLKICVSSLRGVESIEITEEEDFVHYVTIRCENCGFDFPNHIRLCSSEVYDAKGHWFDGARDRYNRRGTFHAVRECQDCDRRGTIVIQGETDCKPLTKVDAQLGREVAVLSMIFDGFVVRSYDYDGNWLVKLQNGESFKESAFDPMFTRCLDGDRAEIGGFQINLLRKSREVGVKTKKTRFPVVKIVTSQPQLHDLTRVPPARQNSMLKGDLLEDDTELSTLGVKEGHNAGLCNLGNTCYLNSTIQCLHAVPELKAALNKYSQPGSISHSACPLTVATRDLFNELDKSVMPVAPMQFWTALQNKFPRYSEQQNSVFVQQDAKECWTQLLYTISESLKSPGSSESADAVKALFGVDLLSRMHSEDNSEECLEAESVYSLKCYMSHEVNNLHEGLKHGMKESWIICLPRYLTIDFDHLSGKRELNEIKNYPSALDVFDLCSDDLRKRLEASRQGSSIKRGESSGFSFEEGVSADKEMHLTGIYDLVAVLTHNGWSPDWGHYIAWVKQDTGKWVEYDDDNPIHHPEEDITKLYGGDGHMANICLYKGRVVPM